MNSQRVTSTLLRPLEQVSSTSSLLAKNGESRPGHYLIPATGVRPLHSTAFEFTLLTSVRCRSSRIAAHHESPRPPNRNEIHPQHAVSPRPTSRHVSPSSLVFSRT